MQLEPLELNITTNPALALASIMLTTPACYAGLNINLFAGT
jgi:hypothetical protein